MIPRSFHPHPDARVPLPAFLLAMLIFCGGPVLWALVIAKALG